MPVRPSHLSIIARLAVYALALVIVASARVPDPRVDATVSEVRARGSDNRANAAWRLAIAGVLLTGFVLEVRRRRPVWH